MTRLPNWPMAFSALVRERWSTPFKWGEHDCCLWAADCIKAIVGRDFARSVRGEYHGPLEAARILEERGGVEGLATAALGEPINLRYAVTGDVVCVEVSGHRSLAVVNDNTILAVGLDGLITLGFDSAICAWKV